jgi:hypothetical protein
MSKEITILNRTFPRMYLWLGGGGLLLIFITLTVLGPRVARMFILGAGAPPSYVDDGFYGYGAAGGGEQAYDLAEESFYPGPEAPAVAADRVGVATQASNAAAVAPADRLIIRTGSLSMEVEDTVATRSEIENLVAEYASQGAFIVSSNESGNTGVGSPYIYMTIRVPSEQFAAIMNELAGMAVEVNERWESADDVTEEFVDLENRLEALESARDRLLEIMINADTTEDLLAAEAQLTVREAEIESLKGRMQYLSTAAKLSSITVNLTPYIVSQPVDTSWDPLRVMRNAFDDLLDNLEDFAEALIRFVIVGIPAIVIWLGVLYLIFLGLRAAWRRLFKPLFKSNKKDEGEKKAE